MDFQNDPIAKEVEKEMSALKEKGVDLFELPGSQYNRIFEAFYKLHKALSSSESSVVGEDIEAEANKLMDGYDPRGSFQYDEDNIVPTYDRDTVLEMLCNFREAAISQQHAVAPVTVPSSLLTNKVSDDVVYRIYRQEEAGNSAYRPKMQADVSKEEYENWQGEKEIIKNVSI